MNEKLVNDLQNIELDMLLEVDRICKKYNIQYFLVAGTLLGAVRHKGFIPWDDDIDICLPLNDYKKFCKICKKELDKKYFLQNYKTDITNKWPAKIRKNGTTAIEKGYETAQIHQGVWIDIFPLVGVKNDKKWITKVSKISLFAKALLRKRNGANSKFKVLAFEKKLLKFIPVSLIKFIVSVILSFIFKHHKKYEFCTYLWGESKITPRFKSVLFSEFCEVEFEGHMFPAPKDWDKYLTIEYGDYMTPPPPEKRNGGSHTISIVDINNNYTKYTKK